MKRPFDSPQGVCEPHPDNHCLAPVVFVFPFFLSFFDCEIYKYEINIKGLPRAVKLVQEVKTPVVKSDGLSATGVTDMAERENRLL